MAFSLPLFADFSAAAVVTWVFSYWVKTLAIALEMTFLRLLHLLPLTQTHTRARVGLFLRPFSPAPYTLQRSGRVQVKERGRRGETQKRIRRRGREKGVSVAAYVGVYALGGM